jgi:Domain of unknown function (DUF4873)
MYVGLATLEVAGIVLEVQATIHVGRDPMDGYRWGGYCTGGRTEMVALGDAAAKHDQLVMLRIHGESDDATVRIIELSGEHAEFEGVGDPPARLRR